MVRIGFHIPRGTFQEAVQGRRSTRMVGYAAVVLGLLSGCGNHGSRNPVSSPAAQQDRPPANATASLEPIAIDTPCVVITALGEVGTKEYGGNNRGARVEEYLASTKLGPNFPWCASYVRWCHAQCGIDLEPARAFAAAAQYATAHEVWHKGQEDMGWDGGYGHDWERICEDADVFTLWYTKLNRIGHCGIVVGESEKYLYTCEGNTGSDGGRDGDGVYRRKRLKSTVYSINRWLHP